MRSASTQLATVSDKTLPKQTLVMSVANDIVATHMKVFRYVTLASNGVSRKLLDSLYSEVFVELTAEGDGLKILSDHPDLLDPEKQELALVLASWPDYFGGVKDLMDVGKTDAPMAVMLLGATDDDFQRIAGQLNAIARQVNRQTASVVSDILTNIDANSGWLAFGEITGILTSILIAIIFARRHIETIALQEKVNEQNIILVKQNKKLEQAAKEKSEFLSNMSHELRTPMHAILGYSKRGFTTIGDRDCAKLEKYFRNIYTSGNRLLGLLNNLLDLSKLESGKVIFDRSHHNFVDVIEHSLIELEPLIKDKRLTVETEITSKDTKITFDKERMIQVIINIISNAVKFSPSGEYICVRLSDGHLPNGGEALCCSVADNGTGIPEAELNMVFDKFMQSSKTKTGAGGTGLGLTICREIIEAHGGKIWADNRYPKGVVLGFMVPRMEQQQANYRRGVDTR